MLYFSICLSVIFLIYACNSCVIPTGLGLNPGELNTTLFEQNFDWLNLVFANYIANNEVDDLHEPLLIFVYLNGLV